MNLSARIENEIRIVADFPKPGIQFKDISGLFSNPQLSKEIIDSFAQQSKGKIDLVCGIESRGFIFGFPIALALDLPFVLVRKKGKLPPPTRAVSYDLEYGSASLEIVEGQIPDGARVMIHDDVLATGGTANATMQLVEELGGKVELFSFLIELDFLQGRKKLNQVECLSLLHY